jgi:hypothetical protein
VGVTAGAQAEANTTANKPRPSLSRRAAAEMIFGMAVGEIRTGGLVIFLPRKKLGLFRIRLEKTKHKKNLIARQPPNFVSYGIPLNA